MFRNATGSSQCSFIHSWVTSYTVLQLASRLSNVDDQLAHRSTLSGHIYSGAR
ncbi:MAG: hypothetical protein ABI333_10335 [bacterium]